LSAGGRRRHRQPLADAAVYRFHRANDEAALAYTDAQGRAALPLATAQQLVVALPGYLLRLSPTSPGSTAVAPQLVQLVADRWSLRCRFRFVLPDGSLPAEVRARVRPRRASRTSPRPHRSGAMTSPRPCNARERAVDDRGADGHSGADAGRSG
jgi:hypothetical protein